MKLINTILIVILIPTSVLANSFHDQVKRKSEKERAEFFNEYLIQNGEKCANVNRVYFQGVDTKRGIAYWNVDCGNDNSYAISIKDDKNGTITIMGCAFLKALNLECFKSLENQ